MADYGGRYAEVVGPQFRAGPLTVIGTVPGTATTDFGAPGSPGPWDDEPLSDEELRRQITILFDCWAAFDRAVSVAPAQLPKGPRGGGRDREPIVAHVRDAERSYCSKLGLRIPARTGWDIQRVELAAALEGGDRGGAWPVRYVLRRCAWHVLDHAWELGDKTS